MKDIKNIQNCCMERFSTFRIGGEAKNVWLPDNEEEFVYLLKNLKNPVVIGSGSNVLFSSGYIDKDIIITQNLDEYRLSDNKLYVEAGVKAPKMVKMLAQKGLSGLEFMIGFPASFGGAIAQNAAAQGQAVSDTFLNAKVYDKETQKIINLEKPCLEFDYRNSVLKNGRYVLISAEFELETSTISAVTAKIEDNLEFRRGHQPMLNLPNIGSIFLNPGGESAGRLLDLCQFKGVAKNDAMVWQNHANFIVNLGHAKAIDVLWLMCEMKRSVMEKFKINLKTEIKFIEGNDEEENKLWKFLQS